MFNGLTLLSCGASPGNGDSHLAAAEALGQALHKRNAHLVYGGGTVGIMGKVAATLVALSGPDSVHGVIPRALVAKEAPDAVRSGVSNEELAAIIGEGKTGRCTVVNDMHERKALMAKLVDAGAHGSGFVALSGGFGTMEEVMEVTTWNQLGIHAKPIILFNVDGYWDGILKWINDAVAAGFITEPNSKILLSGNSVEEVMKALVGYQTSSDRLNLDWSKT